MAESARVQLCLHPCWDTVIAETQGRMAEDERRTRTPAAPRGGDDWEIREQLIRIDERERIARDLHDVVVQELLGAGLHLNRLIGGEPDARRRDQLDRAFQYLEAVVGDLREYIVSLRPLVAGSRTLADALAHVAHTVETQSGALVRIAHNPELATRLHIHASELVKIAREALSNAVRHGQARRCTVALMPVGDLALFYIRDDGHGFDTTTAVAGHGIANMRTRAAQLDGRFDVRSRLGGPTTVSVRWPIPLGGGRTNVA